jgi:hypothetical protein
MNDPTTDYNLEQSQGEIEALAIGIMQLAPGLSFAQAYILAVRKLGEGK